MIVLNFHFYSNLQFMKIGNGFIATDGNSSHGIIFPNSVERHIE